MKNKVFKDFQYVVVYFTYVTEIMSRKRKTQQTNETSAKTVKTNDGDVQPSNVLYWSFSQPALLGKGGFGNVQIWYHHTNGQLYAGKSFKKPQDYHDELARVKLLDHENVIKYVHSYDEQQVIVFDLFACSLHELVTNYTANLFGLTDERIYLLIKHLSNALFYLVNDLHIIHRDIKPANILYNQQKNTFILTDFGLATQFCTETLTYKGFLCGTKEFILPRLLVQCENVEIEVPISSELWSVAITVFFAATGHLPFQTKLRDKWIKLAADKPRECISITNEGDYQYDIEGCTRMSESFKDDVLKPLLLYTMSCDSTFEEYFAKIKHISLRRRMRLFDLLSFRDMCCDNDEMNELYLQHCLFVHKGHIVSKETFKHKSFSETIYFLNMSKPVSVNLVRSLKHQYFGNLQKYFVDPPSRYNMKELECILENVMIAFKCVANHTNSLSMFSKLFVSQANDAKLHLQVIAFSFSTLMSEFFRIYEPKHEFRNTIGDLAKRTKIEIDKGVSDFDLNDILTSESFSAFTKNVELLKQSKLQANRKEHISQIVKTMDIAIESVSDDILNQLKTFQLWVQETQTHIVSLQNLIANTEYAFKNVNTLLIDTVMSN